MHRLLTQFTIYSLDTPGEVTDLAAWFYKNRLRNEEEKAYFHDMYYLIVRSAEGAREAPDSIQKEIRQLAAK